MILNICTKREVKYFFQIYLPVREHTWLADVQKRLYVCLSVSLSVLGRAGPRLPRQVSSPRYIRKRAICIHKRAMYIRKRAIYIRKRAICIHKRAICIHKSAMCIRKRPLPIHWENSSTASTLIKSSRSLNVEFSTCVKVVKSSTSFWSVNVKSSTIECRGLDKTHLTVLEDCTHLTFLEDRECRGLDKTRHVVLRSRRGVGYDE